MRNKILSKEKLVEVAESIIKDESLDACTLRTIAKNANCALGTIYNYFDSRESLLEAVFFQSWDNTRCKLSNIIELKIPTKDKALKMFESVNQDIQNRRGLGEYLFGTVLNAKNKKTSFYKPMESILSIFIDLLKESDKNKFLDEAALKVSAEWIYFGSIIIKNKSKDTESFYKVVIDKFF